jgi:hypothetical protein
VSSAVLSTAISKQNTHQNIERSIYNRIRVQGKGQGGQQWTVDALHILVILWLGYAWYPFSSSFYGPFPFCGRSRSSVCCGTISYDWNSMGRSSRS